MGCLSGAERPVLQDSLAVLAGDKRHTRSVHFERAQYSERLQRCGLGGRPGGEAQRPTVLAAVHPRPEGSFWSLAGTAATGKPGEVNGVPQIHIHPEPVSVAVLAKKFLIPGERERDRGICQCVIPSQPY